METLPSDTCAGPSVKYRPYRSEEYDLNDIMNLVDQELSEPYVVVRFQDMLREADIGVTPWRISLGITVCILCQRTRLNLQGANSQAEISFTLLPSIYLSLLFARVVSSFSVESGNTGHVAYIQRPPRRPHLTWLVYPDIPSEATTTRERAMATIVCKQDYHKGRVNRGYIAMLSVDRAWRRKGIARKLIELAMRDMITHGADEIVLETEYDNLASLTLYGSMGFIKDRRLYRFYLNGKDAFRLVYPVSKTQSPASSHSPGLPESPRPPRRLPPQSSSPPCVPPFSVGDVPLPYISRNGHDRSENGSLPVVEQDNEVAAEADDEGKMDEIQERVESGMTL